MNAMSKSEREDLQRLIRQRERVQKAAAKERSAQLLAEFENQLGSEYSFDQDAVWEEATRLAEQEVKKAQARVAERCRELGIPNQFAPSLNVSWYRRGSNGSAERRAELRRMAQTRVAAMERQAIVQIGLASLQSQTELAISGITSEAAKSFIERLPSVESLMPALSFDEIAERAVPPISEQLIAPTALRRHRPPLLGDDGLDGQCEGESS